jgi:hypothetical protein
MVAENMVCVSVMQMYKTFSFQFFAEPRFRSCNGSELPAQPVCNGSLAEPAVPHLPHRGTPLQPGYYSYNYYGDVGLVPTKKRGCYTYNPIFSLSCEAAPYPMNLEGSREVRNRRFCNESPVLVFMAKGMLLPMSMTPVRVARHAW